MKKVIKIKTIFRNRLFFIIKNTFTLDNIFQIYYNKLMLRKVLKKRAANFRYILPNAKEVLN